MLAQFPGLSILVVDQMSAQEFAAKKLELDPVAIHKKILRLKEAVTASHESKGYQPDEHICFSRGDLLDRLYRTLRTRSNVDVLFDCTYHSISARHRRVCAIRHHKL